MGTLEFKAEKSIDISTEQRYEVGQRGEEVVGSKKNISGRKQPEKDVRKKEKLFVHTKQGGKQRRNKG